MRILEFIKSRIAPYFKIKDSKKIDIKKMSQDDQRATFREAKILEVLNHPNIVKLHSSFLDKKNIYMVFDLMGIWHKSI